MKDNKTIKYYNINAKRFYEDTVEIDLKDFYPKFLKHIPNNGKILDLGCGSGRDSLYFIKKGYLVTSIDGSKEMVKLSSQLTSQKTHLLNIENIDFENEYDGIWAYASLLHIDESITKDVIGKLGKALKKDGVLYASYKYGKGTYKNGLRFFNNYNERDFKKLICEINGLDFLTYWITKDLRPNRQDEKWLSVLMKRN